jgi:hypothetical protein
MPYVTDDDSKAAQRITEIKQQLQEAKAAFERWLAAPGTPSDAAALAALRAPNSRRVIALSVMGMLLNWMVPETCSCMLLRLQATRP